MWAHPDDETFTCGGILAAAARNGQRVVCITATKGEAGVQDAERWPPIQLAEIRATELGAALDILGVTEHHWLGYSDGECSQVDELEAVTRISEIMREVQPDTILTFGPDGLTGHPDHQAVSRWASAAVSGAESPVNIYHAVVHQDTYYDYLKAMDEELNMFFNIDKPPLFNDEQCDICIKLPAELTNKKCAALKAMPSQTDALFTKFDPNFICNAFTYETFVKAK